MYGHFSIKTISPGLLSIHYLLYRSFIYSLYYLDEPQHSLSLVSYIFVKVVMFNHLSQTLRGMCKCKVVIVDLFASGWDQLR